MFDRARKLNEEGMKGAGIMREDGDKVLTNHSLTEVRPFYSYWAFWDGEVHALLEALRCLGYEIMQNLSLRIQKLLYMS